MSAVSRSMGAADATGDAAAGVRVLPRAELITVASRTGSPFAMMWR